MFVFCGWILVCDGFLVGGGWCFFLLVLVCDGFLVVWDKGGRGEMVWFENVVMSRRPTRQEAVGT